MMVIEAAVVVSGFLVITDGSYVSRGWAGEHGVLRKAKNS